MSINREFCGQDYDHRGSDVCQMVSLCEANNVVPGSQECRNQLNTIRNHAATRAVGTTTTVNIAQRKKQEISGIDATLRLIALGADEVKEVKGYN